MRARSPERSGRRSGSEQELEAPGRNPRRLRRHELDSRYAEPGGALPAARAHGAMAVPLGSAEDGAKGADASWQSAK